MFTKIRKKIVLRFLRITFLLFLLVCYGALLSFSSAKISRTEWHLSAVQKLPEDVDFVHEKDPLLFEKFEKKQQEWILPYREIYSVNQQLRKNPYLSNVFLYGNRSGELKIKYFQRIPFFRVQNIQGQHFYIDKEGNFFPNKMGFASEVPYVSGYVFESFLRHRHLCLDEIEKNASLKSVFILDDIRQVIREVEKDTVLKYMIKNYYVNNKSEIELIPVVGKQKILLGHGERITQKLKKLSLFYRDVVSGIDLNMYSLINLKFKNQIICTKRNTNR